MNPTMNSQKHKTIRADMGAMVIGLQLDNITLRPNLKPKTTSHNQKPDTNPPLLTTSASP